MCYANPVAAKRGNPEQTRAEILAGARQCFVRKGRRGTSMQEIAKAAGVAQSLIHHYFRTKEELWLAVADEELRRYTEPQRRMLEQVAAPSPTSVEASFRTYFAFLRDNPVTWRLLTWMALDGMEPSDLPEAAALEDKAVAGIRLGQSAGLIRDDVHPRFVLLMFRALVHAWFAERVRPSDLAELGEDELDELYVGQAWKLFAAAVAGPAAPKP